MRMNRTQDAAEALGAKIGAGLTYTGSGGAVTSGLAYTADAAQGGGLTLAEWGIIVGIFTALIGLAIQAYFGFTRHRREAEAHAANMRRLNGGTEG